MGKSISEHNDLLIGFCDCQTAVCLVAKKIEGKFSLTKKGGNFVVLNLLLSPVVSLSPNKVFNESI